MAMSLRLARFACSVRALSCPQVRAMSGGEWGSGKGKGGGSGGTVRDAGGSFGKMEAAHEEEYFRRQQQEQLKALRDHHRDELKAHQQQIKSHEEEIKRHKKQIEELNKITGHDD